jgi:hypothetical protein
MDLSQDSDFVIAFCPSRHWRMRFTRIFFRKRTDLSGIAHSLPLLFNLDIHELCGCLSPMSPINNLATCFKSLKNFRIAYPIKRDFSQKTTWWFTSVASFGIVITMLGVAAASGYEPIPSYSRTFNITSPLWYEVLLGNATSSLGLSASRVCSGSVIELGNGALHTPPRPYVRINEM